MPVLVVVEVPGGSSELDVAFLEAWGLASSPPAGNLLRLSGPMDGGRRVVSLWESRQQFVTFLEERLHLSLEDAGAGQPVVSFWDDREGPSLRLTRSPQPSPRQPAARSFSR